MKRALAEHGHRSKEYIRVRDQIGNELMNIRFTARIIERLCDSLRGMVDEVRSHEREIMNLCVTRAACCGLISSRSFLAARPTCAG